MRLALGTAQFGMKYGALNVKGKPSLESITNTLSTARKLGIDTLDTAVAYGDSEVRLGRVGISGWNVITKVSRDVDAADLHDEVLRSLDRLRINRLAGLLFHNADNLLDDASKWSVLVRAKEAGLVAKIGVSVYDTDQLRRLIDRFDIDIIQAPLNVFDQRMATEGWVQKLAERGVQLHIRSLFLQGTLLADRSALPPYFSNWAPAWERLESFSVSRGLSRLATCLSVATMAGVTKAVVGVDDASQLFQMAEAFEAASGVDTSELAQWDLRLIDPRRWSL